MAPVTDEGHWAVGAGKAMENGSLAKSTVKDDSGP
jgi:hypothetical protein